MIKPALLAVEEKYYQQKELSEFNIGDTVDVHIKIKEGDRERIQVFNGTVIRRKGRGANETFTVRRIVNEEGVERTWPLLCPSIVKIEVKRKGRVRRAKLYYLRDRKGKATKVRELRVARSKKAKQTKETNKVQQAVQEAEAAVSE